MGTLCETTSFDSCLRDHEVALVERLLPPASGILRLEKKPSGSRGSAVFSEQTWEEIAGHLGLSHREIQIVQAVFDDRTEFAIAAGLGISPHTVHTYFERLHKKLGVADRVQLVLRIAQDFLPPAALPNGLPLDSAAHQLAQGV